MTAIPQPGASRLASERLTKPLRDVASRQWNLLAATGALRALGVGLAVVLVASLMLGFFSGVPFWLRIALSVLTWAAVLAAAAYFLRPALRRRTLADAAFAVESRVEGLNERISSAVELSNDPGPFAGSPVLIRHLLRQAEADAAAVRPDAIVPADAAKKAALLLAPLLVLWLALAVLIPRPLLGGLYRTLMPWRDHLPVLLSTIVVTPGDVTLAEGDALTIHATVNASSGADPQAGRALLLTRAAGTSPAQSRDLNRVSPREFDAVLPDLRQTFSYSVSTEAGDSAWYTATVLPRPAVARLDLRYAYPTYTGLDAKVEDNRDGAIRALQGTDVTLTIHTADTLDPAPGKSRITVTEGARKRDVEIEAVDGAVNVYRATLTVFNSGSYRVHLVNRHGLTNKDDHPRPIVADLDRPPAITLLSPPAETTVRADDDVPVTFAASDDFGVAGVQAMVQVDDKPPLAVDVNLSRGADRRKIDGRWELVVPQVMGSTGVTEARAITYWLRVTDNRDPDPQSTESARQVLKIDKGQPLALKTRLEQQHARDMIQAIDRAIHRLNQSHGQVDSLRHVDASRAMNAGEKARAEEQREHLATTSRELAEAAEVNLRNGYAAVAARAQEIAETPIRGAAENVARSLLSADRAEPRRAAATKAAEQVVQARDQLEELKRKVEARSKELQAARELEKLAEKQAELSREQQQAAAKPAEGPEQKKEGERQQERFARRQRELAERLQRTIGESEPLREPKATEQAIRLRELIDRVEQIQRDQAPLQEQVARQQELSRLQDRAEALAAKQQELNEAIESFTDGQRPTLQRADAYTLDRQHQAGIVDRLRQGETEQAHGMQRQSAERLEQSARQLQERRRSRDLRPDPVQQHLINEREQAKQTAEQAAEAAKQAARQLEQAKGANDAGQIKEAQKAVDEAAQKLTAQARAAAEAVKEPASSGDPTAEKDARQAREAADAAQAAAEAARQAARQADVQQASRKLEEAGKQLAQAQKEALEATRADMLADQQAASKSAAETAKELAARQAELAQATREDAAALSKARENQQSPQDVANRQNELKDQSQQAARQADQLEQLGKSTQSPVAERAAAAEKRLEEAAAAAARATQAERAVAQAQQQAAQAAQQAAQANQQAAQLDQQAAQVTEQAAAQEQQAEIAQRQAADAQVRDDKGATQAHEQQVKQAKQQATQHRQQSQNFERQSKAAAQRAGEAAKRADAAQESSDAAREQAARHQAQAREALALAEDALRDVDRTSAEASGRPKSSRENSADPGAEPKPDDPPGSAQESQQQADAGKPPAGAPAPPPLTPDQAMRRAAQGAQEAAQAQQQSINNNADPGASRQAAAALEQAAAAMAAATSANNDAADSAVAGADEPPEPGAPTEADRSDRPGAMPSARAADSRTGIGTGKAVVDSRPLSVQELGISAGDWARLGPLTRQELLNAAQQSGPPAYREMIKNYYVRIAKLQARSK
jgi:hypothetical protein